MSSQVQQICKDAVAQIAPDVREGLVGTNSVGFHVAIFSLTSRELVYEEGFGAKCSKGGAYYRDIALDKAELVLEERRSLSSLIEEGLRTDMHNGGFIDGDIIVAVAGAGHMGNVRYGRDVLRYLIRHLPDQAALAA